MVTKSRQEIDPIVAEVRETKDRMASKFNYDVEAILRDAQQREAAGGKLVVSRAKRAPEAA